MSREGDAFEVPRHIAILSQLIKDTFEDDDEDDDGEEEETEIKEMSLPNVSKDVLEKVIEYCTHYHEEPMASIQTPLKSTKLDELVQPWYASFVQVERTMLFDLVAAANFMDIKPLLDLGCLAVAITIKGKSAAELREMFNVSQDAAEDVPAENNGSATATKS